MRIYIITDLEGISGVDSIDMMDENSEGYKLACERLMSDTNAAIEGAFAGGADKVYVVDGHGSGQNFIKGKLHPDAIQVSAREFVKSEASTYDVDAFFSIGAHAMVGTENAFLDHTQYSIKWFDYKINGKSFGELGQQAIAFGLADIPLVMVSGDDAACAEAKELSPNLQIVRVKTAKGRNRADCISPEKAYEAIFNAAKEAVRNIGNCKPYKIEFPVKLELTFTRNDYCDEVMENSPYLKRCGRTVYKELEKINNYHDLVVF